jgi:hypothetical protein
MDLLVEKLDGSRYYLSQYKVLITDFEESAPSVTRNSTQLDQRNGNIDFGGWHTDKTINITGYYRADDMDEEEMLRERLYALLSDPNGYYITQLKTTPSVSMERPGETSGGYYDKLKDYPSHKRFLVYTEAPEMELVGNVGGTLLYKLSAEFKTMKLPYGETVAEDINLPGKYDSTPINLLVGTATPSTHQGTDKANEIAANYNLASDWKSHIAVGDNVTVEFDWALNGTCDKIGPQFGDAPWAFGMPLASPVTATGHYKSTFTADASLLATTATRIQTRVDFLSGTITVSNMRMYPGTSAPWSPNPSELAYDVLDGTVAIPYTGTVPCKQVEQGFSIQLTATGSASSLSFKVDDTELTYSNAVAAGDVILLSGFSYTQNGLSIVSKTNKAYFILQPDKPNKITCNVPGTVRILGFQNLYA